MAAEYVQQMGARIAARRTELGLSQVDVARALPGKVDGSQVSRWERGLHRPSDDTLERLGEILDVPVAYFMAPEAAKENGTPDLFLVPSTPDERLTRIERTLAEMRTERDEHAHRVEELLQEQGELLATIKGLLGMEGEPTLQDRLVQMLRDAQAKAGPGPGPRQPAPQDRS